MVISGGVLVSGAAALAVLAPGGLGDPHPRLVTDGLSSDVYRATVGAAADAPGWLHSVGEHAAVAALLVLAALLAWIGWTGWPGRAGAVVSGIVLVGAGSVLAYLGSEKGELAQHWRYSFEIGRAANAADADNAKLVEKRRLGLEAVRRQREALEELSLAGQVGADAFLILQEELDFTEVTLTNESERRIEEN